MTKVAPGRQSQKIHKRNSSSEKLLERKLSEQEEPMNPPLISRTDLMLLSALFIFLIGALIIWFRFPAQLGYHALPERSAPAAPNLDAIEQGLRIIESRQTPPAQSLPIGEPLLVDEIEPAPESLVLEKEESRDPQNHLIFYAPIDGRYPVPIRPVEQEPLPTMLATPEQETSISPTPAEDTPPTP